MKFYLIVMKVHPYNLIPSMYVYISKPAISVHYCVSILYKLYAKPSVDNRQMVPIVGAQSNVWKLIEKTLGSIKKNIYIYIFIV